MKSKKADFNRELQNHNDRRNFLSLLFFWLLAFVTEFLFKKRGTGLLDTQSTNNVIKVKSSGRDDTANINNAINTVSHKGGGKVLLPDSNYLALGIQLKSNVVLEGYNTKITKNGGGGNTYILESIGKVTGVPFSLTADAKICDTIITVSGTKSIKSGDYILVRDNIYVSKPLGRNQEICRVSSVTPYTVSFSSPLIGSYAIDFSAEFVKISPIINASVKGIIFDVPSSTSGSGFYGLLNVGTIVQKCESLRPKENAAFGFEQSALCKVVKCKARDGQTLSKPGTSYGFYIGDSSHDCYVENCYSENVRENPISFNVRRSGFINNKDKGSYDDSFNTHGTGNDHIYIRGNWSTGSKGQGISVGTSTHHTGDTNVFIENNVIVNSGINGIVINAPNNGSRPNKNIFVKDNKINNWGTSGVNSYGIIASYSNGIFIGDNEVDGKSNSFATAGIILTTITNGKIRSNDILDISNGYGIIYQVNCNDVLIERNTFNNVSSFNIISSGTNINVTVRQNKADDTS